MFASPLFWQIRYLVTNLNKKNLKSSISELNQLIELYGEDARLFLLQCLVEETGFKEQKTHAHHANKDAQKLQLLQHEVAQATGQSNFVSAICRALEGWGGSGRDRLEQSHGRHSARGGTQGSQGPHRITEDFLGGFCRSLKLTPAQQVAVGLGLSRSPNPAVAKEGVKFLVARVPGLAGAASGGHLSLEALHSLLELVNSREEVSGQPRLAKALLRQIREAHQELLAGLQQVEGGSGGGSPQENETGGTKGTGKSGGGGSSGNRGGGGGGDALASSGTADAAASGGGNSGSAANSVLEADAVALVPLFSEDNLEMNYLNKTSGAMSLSADVAGIANSIGQGGSLAGFLKDLGHTSSSSPGALRQAIRESGVVVDERQIAQVITMLANNYNSSKGQGDDGDLSSALTNSLFSSAEGQMGDGGRDGGPSGQSLGLWKLDFARQVLAEDYGPRIDWIAVAKAFDHDRFNIPDQVGLAHIRKAVKRLWEHDAFVVDGCSGAAGDMIPWLKGARSLESRSELGVEKAAWNALRVLLALYRGPSGRDLPSESLYSVWENRRGQLSLLRAAINAPPQVFTFSGSPSTQAPLEGLDPSATPNGAWLSLDLVTALLSLASDTELYAPVRDVFSKPAYECPELLLLALAAVPSEAGGCLRVELLSRLLPLYFRPNRNTHAAALIRRLWQVNPRLVVQSGVKAFNVDNTLPSVVYVLRIMRLVSECAVELLASNDCAFAVAVASVMYGAESPDRADQHQQQTSALPPLDMAKWCTDRLCREDREVFATRVLSFVQAHLPTARLRSQSQKAGESPGEGPVPTCPMSLEAAAIFLRALGGTGHIGMASEVLAKKNPVILASATQLTEAARKLHPAIQPLLHHLLPGEEIEDIANSYFQRIYTSEQSIEEVIAMLQRFKSSSDAREQEIFACMVHNLFDEYRFFHNYPEKELRITGVLFGSLIQHQLVSSITLGIALRYVLEALRKPPGPDSMGKMFRFGMFALEQFKGRLGEWPQYCSHIVQIPHLVANHPALVEEIERSMQRPPEQRLPPTAVAPGPPRITPSNSSVQQHQPPQHQPHPQPLQLVPGGGLSRPSEMSVMDAGGAPAGLGVSGVPGASGGGGTVVGSSNAVAPQLTHGQPQQQQQPQPQQSQPRMAQAGQGPDDRGTLSASLNPATVVGRGSGPGQQGVGPPEHPGGLVADAMLTSTAGGMAASGQGHVNSIGISVQGGLGMGAAPHHQSQQQTPLQGSVGGQMASQIGMRSIQGQQTRQGQPSVGGSGAPSGVPQQQPMQPQQPPTQPQQQQQLSTTATGSTTGTALSHPSQSPQSQQQTTRHQQEQVQQLPLPQQEQSYGRSTASGSVDGPSAFPTGGGAAAAPGTQMGGPHADGGGGKEDGSANGSEASARGTVSQGVRGAANMGYSGRQPSQMHPLAPGNSGSASQGNIGGGPAVAGGARTPTETSSGNIAAGGATGASTAGAWGARAPVQGASIRAPREPAANGLGGTGGGAVRSTETARAPTGALPPKQPEGLGTPNMERLMAKVEEPTPMVNPPESVMDRIHFVINNVTASNLSSKVNDIKPHVQNHPEHHPWLANYLVVKRICTQPNFHDLYLELVNQLETPALMDAILRSVFHNVGKLLRSQKIITSTSERSLLKNLGSWLGKITLGKDKPVLQRDLDIKELLFQGYETGRLIAVTPFVAKILEGAPSGKSRVFKPPNPWIMGIFSALHEMYELQDLKMNIKFEIEMLCQKFNVTLADVPKYGRLRTRMTPQKEKNPDFNLAARTSARTASEPRTDRDETAGAFSGEAAGAASQDGVAGGTPGGPGGANKAGGDGGLGREGVGDMRGAGGVALDSTRGVGGPGDRGAAAGGAGGGGGNQGAGAGVGQPVKSSGQSVSAAPDQQQTVIPNLASYVTINPAMEAFSTQPHLKEVLKRVVPVAVDRAIREIIQPVVERSVTIACITSKELVQKDFAMEADENKIRKAAHLMVSNLAGSLALVTCKEPLRVSIGNHMRSLLGPPLTDQGTIEMLVQLCSSDNLELGCMLIEKAATEKAMRDIDEAIAPSLQARRKSRETTGQPYYDMSIFNSLRYPAALPDALRPKPGGLHHQQLLVYEAFQRVPRQPTLIRSPAGPIAMSGPAGSVPGPTPSSPASPAMTGVQGPVTGVGSASGGSASKVVELTLDQALQAWQGAISRLDMAIGRLLAAHRRQGGPEPSLHTANRDQELSAALQEIVTVGKGVPPSSREEALTKFSRAVFNRLFDMARGKEDNPAGVPLLRVEVYAAVLELCLRTVKNSSAGARKEDLLSQWYTSLPPQALAGSGSRKLHLGALKYLIQMHMVDLEKLDVFLVRNITLPIPQQGAPHQLLQDEWGIFTVDLIRQCVFDQQESAGPDGKAFQVSTMKSFAKSLETLSQLHQDKRPMVTAKFIQLAGDLRVATHPDQPRKMTGPGADGAVHGQKGVMANRGDPAGAREEVTQLLQFWMRMNENSAADEGGITNFLGIMSQRNILKTEESTDRFMRVATELVVEACLKSSRPQPAPLPGEEKSKGVKLLSYAVVDAYVKLLVVLVRSRSAQDPATASNARLALLSRVLTAIVRAIIEDFETRKSIGSAGASGPFDQRPYFRLLVGLLQDMNKPDRNLDSTNLQVLMSFSSALHAVNPCSVPGFAFAWLELVSHRTLMPNLLLAKQNKGWAMMHRLLVDLFVFMEPHLRRPSLIESVRILYTGMLRTLLVLLHDFPEFLCDYHLSFCDVIPPSCIQLRNLVLSAFPRSMRLPDPFTPNLKVDLLPEIMLAPRILSNYMVSLNYNNIRADLDKFLQTRHHPPHFLSELAGKLRLSPQEAAHTGMTYDVPCINSLVVYVGSQAIIQLNHKPIITHSAPMDVFHQLANKLDPEGRYFFLNAVANQLRYPNQHTHYFSCVLLYLFAEAQSEMVQEQITRILLERLIVHRPHPWGVLITFIELIKNPRYSFWSHGFTHCTPELERVFESVARSCMAPGGAAGVAGAEDDGTASSAAT